MSGSVSNNRVLMKLALVTGPSAGAVVAQGISVSPSLLYISQGGSAGIAIGTNIVSWTALDSANFSDLLPFQDTSDIQASVPDSKYSYCRAVAT